MDGGCCPLRFGTSISLETDCDSEFARKYSLFSLRNAPCGILLHNRSKFRSRPAYETTGRINLHMEATVRRDLPMILIRVLVGLVFLIEGSLKFLRPEDLGVGRFAEIGLPFPHYLAPVVGGIEIAGGAAILLNFYAGDAALALLIVILTALVTTKLPILLGRPLGPFPLDKLKEYGWMSFFHEALTELCMVFGLLAIVIDSGIQIGRRRKWYQSGSQD